MTKLWQTLRYLKSLTKHPLTQKTGGSLKRLFCYQLAKRLLPNTGFIVPFVGDVKLMLGSGMPTAAANYYCGLNEFDDMGFLLHFLREDDLFCDVGANIGSYTLLASGVCGGKSVSFEPGLKTFNSLQKNIKLNGLENKVELLNMAVGSCPGVVKFTTSLDTLNHVLTSAENDDQFAEVPVVTLDDTLKDKIPILVKIDVEGFEAEVVKGMKRILSSSQCRALFVEIGWGEGRYGFNEDLLCKEIMAYGFRPYFYDPIHRKLISRELLNCKEEYGNGSNILYVRDADFVQKRLGNAPKREINGYVF